MADIPLVMPQLGVDIEEGQIDSWLKQVGDRVEKGEQIAMVTTPKVNLELEAPASGTLKEITVPADEIARVGDTLAIIAAD
ncbi:MAG: lipoyl domain-containing protein [Rhizobiales bacterium]|nr:lipoyl domain-containing protein [Hyphomicrobiales bacterium]MBN9010221.1 lipoyl domain-containing protein [Hyphomicrobiales bacterium]